MACASCAGDTFACMKFTPESRVAEIAMAQDTALKADILHVRRVKGNLLECPSAEIGARHFRLVEDGRRITE